MREPRLPLTKLEFHSVDAEAVKNLSQVLDLPEFVARILVQRGYSNIEDVNLFINPNLNHLHDPFLLNDMNVAVDRIRQALRNQEKILICGDYDVDGITSVVLLKMVLPGLGLEVYEYLPNRLSEGYGLHPYSVDYAASINASLIITVDCGITSWDAVEYARGKQIDIIITDHHEPNGPLPRAHAIINPKREDSTYPDKNLAGIGVAFKLVQALIQEKILQFPLPPLLELVALGTIADVAKLTGENRIFVTFGLEALAHTSNPGLKALMRVSKVIHGRKLEPSTIGFQLGPRINAVGRLGKPEQALDLLLAKSRREATLLAEKLNHSNFRRQMIEEKIFKTVEAQASQMNIKEEPFIIVSGNDWHEGVIGIVASKITERYYRPSCVISIKDGIGKGSGRSIACFSLFDCLSEVKSLLIEFGGHQIAAGFRILPENIDQFRNACIKIARDKLSQDNLMPKTFVDVKLDLNELNFKSIKAMQKLAPFGLGNPKPRLLIHNLHSKFAPKQVGMNGSHLKLAVTNGSKVVDAIGFNFGNFIHLLRSCEMFDVIATPEINVWNDREIIQLHIHDIHPHIS